MSMGICDNRHCSSRSAAVIALGVALDSTGWAACCARADSETSTAKNACFDKGRIAQPSFILGVPFGQSVYAVNFTRVRAPASTSISHAVVVRTTTPFRRNPSDDLIRVGNVAGLAMDAVRRVQADALPVGC